MKKGDLVRGNDGAVGVVRSVEPRYVACGPHGHIIKEDVYVDWYISGEPPQDEKVPQQG